MENKSNLDYFLLQPLKSIQKKLFIPNMYLWIDQNIQNTQNQKIFKQLQENEINPILCQSIEKAKQYIKKYPKEKFRIITTASMGEATCKQFNSNQQVIHIYIFCGYRPAGQALQKKWKNKIKFYTIDVKQFLIKIKEQSRIDNRFSQLPTFIKITTMDNTHDNTLINKSRYNLHGLLKFKNRTQAKNDFIKLARYFYSSDTYKSQLSEFENDYPIQYNHPKSLNWYTQQTFFYKLLNNFLKSSINPLQTSYLRLPFDATFKAIKQIYDQGNQHDRMMKQNNTRIVFRGTFISDKQLKDFENNVGQYIEMFGFMSTSTTIKQASKFIKNSLITLLIDQKQQRDKRTDYGYADLIQISQFKYQGQILFNALNVFKIVSFTPNQDIQIQKNNIKQKIKINKITLKYGQLARIVNLGEGKLQMKQKQISINYKHQQEIISKFNHQGDVLHYCQMYNSQLKYREKYMKEIKEQQTINYASQLFKMGLLYDQKANYKNALQYYERALKIIENLRDKRYSTTNELDHLQKENEWYDKVFQYYQYNKYYQISLKINRNILKENHNSNADTLHNIGRVYHMKSYYDKALQYYQRSLEIKMNRLRDNHITAITLQNMGIVYKNKAEYNKALQYFQRSLYIFGENHTSTADAYQNIGNVYGNKADYNKALQYYGKSLKINNYILGEHHSTAMTLQNIGIVYRNKSEYDKALQYFQRSLKIKIKIFGKNHTSTADTYQNIGNVYGNKAVYITAQRFYQKSLKINKNIFGENHISIAGTLNNLGIVYKNKAEYDKALQYFQRSLKIKIKLFGENHTSTAYTYQNIGNVYGNKADYVKALQYHERSLEIKINIFGENHISTASILNNIGNVYTNKADYKKALKYYERSQNIKMDILGLYHSSTAVTLLNIGLLYYNQKQYPMAKIYFQKCYKIRLKIFGSAHQLTEQVSRIVIDNEFIGQR